MTQRHDGNLVRSILAASPIAAPLVDGSGGTGVILGMDFERIIKRAAGSGPIGPIHAPSGNQGCRIAEAGDTTQPGVCDTRKGSTALLNSRARTWFRRCPPRG